MSRLAHPNLRPYPPAETGMKRLVIVLEGAGRTRSGDGPVTGEDNMEVELIAGANIVTDGVNQYRMQATIEEGTVSGYGYPYWTVKGDVNTVASTRMGGRGGRIASRPSSSPEEKEFVEGSSLKVGYNSRLPIVIYCQEDMECQYRIWKVVDKASTVMEG